VFPDKALLGGRRNLSFTRFKLKLGVEIALRSVIFSLRFFPSTSGDAVTGLSACMMAYSSIDNLVEAISSVDKSGVPFSVVMEKCGKCGRNCI
jgi:hypothetical protein